MDSSKGFGKRPQTLANTQVPLTESQLRQSNGFSASGNAARMRISGQGFRPSSRERTQTGEDNGQYSLNIFPLGQDELAWASNLKVDLMQLQEEINQLDSDNKLRTSGTVDFGKGYQSQMKKWLGSNCEPNIKQLIDKKLKGEIDAQKICEVLGCKGNFEEGLKKLFRLCSVADVAASKLTEFEMLTLMRYDDSYNNLVKDESQQSKLKMMAAQGAYQFSKYQVCFVNLERFCNLLKTSRKLASKETGSFLTSNESEKIEILEQSQKELKEVIRKRDFKIKELQEKIVDLETKVESQLEEINKSQNKQEAKPPQKSIGKAPESFKDNPEYWTNLIDETKQFYETRMREYENENCTLKEKIEDFKIKLESLQEQFFDLQEKVGTIKQEKELLFQTFSKKYNTREEAVDSYEDALKEEFERMKKAFEKRVDTLIWDSERVKKEKARGLVDMKLKMDKEIETKNLVLKKLSCYIK